MIDSIINGIIEYENGTMSEEEIINFFQLLYNTGDWKRLEGHYEDTMVSLINTGKIQMEDN